MDALLVPLSHSWMLRHVVPECYITIVFVRSGTTKTEAFTPLQMSTCSLTRTSHDMRKVMAAK